MQLNNVEVLSVWPSLGALHSFSGKRLRAVVYINYRLCSCFFFYATSTDTKRILGKRETHSLSD